METDMISMNRKLSLKIFKSSRFPGGFRICLNLLNARIKITSDMSETGPPI